MSPSNALRKEELSTEPRSAPQFDAFVVYNTSDRPEVEHLCDGLKARGLRLWIDYEQTLAGSPFQSVLAHAMQASDAAIVFFGRQGVGAWQTAECATLMSLFVDQEIKRLIPVLLPGVEDVPDALGIVARRSLRFREGMDEQDALDELERAITGREPRASRWPFEIHIPVPRYTSTCFIACPLQHGDQSYDAIERAVKAAGMEIGQCRDSQRGGFEPDVARGVRVAGIVIADCVPPEGTSAPAPEVIYALGLANALCKPMLVLTDEGCLLPPVIMASHRIEFRRNELETGQFEHRLSAEIRDAVDRLAYPFLTERKSDDSYVIRTRLASRLVSVWPRLRQVLQCGVSLLALFREVAKHAHKLAYVIERLCSDRHDLSEIGNRELHERNWHVFESAFSEGYLGAHRVLEDAYPRHTIEDRHDVEHSFKVLMSAFPVGDTTGEVGDSLESSRRHYCLVCESVALYFNIHEHLMQHMAHLGPDKYQQAPLLRALCREIVQVTDLISSNAVEMLNNALKVIVSEPEAGDSKISSR